MPKDYIIGTGQNPDTDDVDDDDRLRNEIVRGNAVVSVEQWVRQSLTVTDDPPQNRFLIKIGRIIFPIGYEQIAMETNIIPGADSIVSHVDKSQVVMIESQNKKKEEAKRKITDMETAKAELAKPLVVKRIIMRPKPKSNT